jgi:hypothetical protein
LRERFLEFDDALAAKGVPPLTEWWRAGIGGWLDAYEGLHVLELWACVGRGSAKSTALYKLAVFFALFVDFQVPPGEVHYAIVLSRLKEEAAKGVGIIHRWLELLGIPHGLAGDVIELPEMRRGVRVVAASVAAASGWRSFFVAKDERSKWPESEILEREADEIDASAGAMTATHALAPTVTVGSAWFAFGSFHETIAAGTTAERVVLGPTATWIAAPHITEASTRKKERNPAKWQREYACVPTTEAEESVFDAVLVEAAMRPNAADVPPEPNTLYLGAMYPSLGRNGFSFVICGLRYLSGRMRASVVLAREWRSKGAKLDPGSVLEVIAGLARPYGVRRIITDQFHAETLASIATRMELGITIEIDKPTAQERLARFENVATRFADHAVELPRHPQIRADLLAVRRRLTAGANGFVIHLPTSGDGRHCDWVPPIILCLSRLPRVDSQLRAYEARVEEAHAALDRIEGYDDSAQLQAAAKQRVRGGDYYERVRAEHQREIAKWDAFVKRAGVDPETEPRRGLSNSQVLLAAWSGRHVF